MFTNRPPLVLTLKSVGVRGPSSPPEPAPPDPSLAAYRAALQAKAHNMPSGHQSLEDITCMEPAN